MVRMNDAVRDFLDQKRIAVAGVSRSGKQPANLVYRKLRDNGYQVFPVNPKASEVEGDKCYSDLKCIPGGVEAVFIATPPDAAPQIVRECLEAGVSNVWMHRSFGQGSVSSEALRFCRENDMTVIAGGCPMMFCEPVDFGHKCMRWILNWTGGLP